MHPDFKLQKTKTRLQCALDHSGFKVRSGPFHSEDTFLSISKCVFYKKPIAGLLYLVCPRNTERFWGLTLNPLLSTTGGLPKLVSKETNEL